ncbi:2-phospho-L-lactate transferase [Desertibaculum subflavum]|uniref:2-phospho-L-lactate transferase n=1 Tax=Desertibaculum subflavum TaxID=2268458 RepID=UPI000E65FFF7
MARDQIVALAGGVGGAKLALGLAAILGERLSIVVNTADDFEHLGLHVSPDLDTVMYTLAGLANPETGWGRAGESWNFMAALSQLGGESWFNLGDRDLATHVERTRRLRAGETLAAVTADLCRRLGIASQVLPMSNDAVRTVVATAEEGELDFQHWFVRRRCEPAVTVIRFAGIEGAAALPEALALLAGEAVRGLVICPSNPFVSVAPILAVPGLRASIERLRVPRVAVTPIVGGQAIKGPAAKMLAELGHPVSAAGVAACYRGLIDGFVLDQADRSAKGEIEGLGMRVLVADTMMRTHADKRRLAGEVLDFVDKLAAAG